jgi:hypothetical protein
VYAAGIILVELLLDWDLGGEQSASLRVTKELATIMAERKSRKKTRAKLLTTELGRENKRRRTDLCSTRCVCL